MTHKDKGDPGWSKSYEEGFKKIDWSDNRIPCKKCGEPISKYYAKKHNGLCLKCKSKR